MPMTLVRAKVNGSLMERCPEDAADRLEIADVGTHEHVVRGIPDVLEVGQVAGVRQLVQIHYAVLGVLVDEQADYVAAYEAGSAGYQYIALIIHN